MDLTKRARTYQFKDRSFTEEEINTIANQKGLVALSFTNCPITDSHIERLSVLPELVNLCLDKTKITDISLEYISKITSLQYLFITDANINGAGLKHFKEHKKIDTLGLDNTLLNDEGIIHVLDFKKLGVLRITNTKVSYNGLLSVAQNNKLHIIGSQFSEKEMADFEALQRKLNKKKLAYTKLEIDQSKLLLNNFFRTLTEWEKKAENEGFTEEIAVQCVAIFKEYCTEKPRKGYRPNWLSNANGPNYTYNNQVIVDIEQLTKRKIFIYTKDNYLNAQYRFVMVKKETSWKIDQCYVHDGGWKTYGL